MATDKNKHLKCVLESHKIKKEQELLEKHKEKKEEIKDALQKKYGAIIYTPFNSGSYAKNTAMNKKFDFDFMVPFKRNAFPTLAEMFDDVFNFLNDKYKSTAQVRKQKVSIGLEFLNENGESIKIDVVPGRELNIDQYIKDKNLNLYINDQYGILQKGSERIQSNIHAQIEKIKSTSESLPNLRQVIRLLKIWKHYNNKSIKSFFIELITIKAFESKSPEGEIWDILKIVLEFIKDNIKTVSLPDPGNTNNNVAETMNETDKNVISFDIQNILDQIELNSDFIKTYFPFNSKFPCEDENKNNNTYGIKRDSPSVPPPTRFGN